MKKLLSAILAVVMIISAIPLCSEINTDFNIISISAIGAQLNGLNKTDGKWYYYKNGKIDKSFEGMAKNQYGWWYVKNGTIDFSYTGMAKNQYGWWYMKNGKLDTTYTGMAKNQYGWWYMKNGKLDTTYTGMAKNQYGWWYMKNGKLDTTYTGMAKNQYGWWYIKNGKLDKTYTGIAKNQYGYWYMKNGKLDKSYNGTYTDSNGNRWVIVNGKATQSSKNTITANTKNVTIVEGNYVDITLRIYAPDDFVGIYYDYKGNSIVSCEWTSWGSWNGDYLTRMIRIYGINPGKDTVVFYFDDQKNDIKESVNVTVTEKQPNYTLQIPKCPMSVSEYDHRGALMCTAKITDIKCEIDQDRSSMNADLTITGTKMYDDGSSVSSICRIGYKLYDENGVVVKSGVFRSPKVSIGESFIISDSLYGSNLVPGKYRLEIIDLYG